MKNKNFKAYPETKWAHAHPSKGSLVPPRPCRPSDNMRSPLQLCILALQPDTTPHTLRMLLLLLLPHHPMPLRSFPDDRASACLPCISCSCLCNTPPPAAVSYLLILDLFFNFFRYFVSKSWHEQCLWGGAAQVRVGQDG